MPRCTQQVISFPPLPEPKPPPPGGKSMRGTSEGGGGEECSDYSTETAESTRLNGRVKGSRVLDAFQSTPDMAARLNQQTPPQKEAMRVALEDLEDLYRLEKEKGEKSRAKATAEREALEATIRVRHSESLESANTPSEQGSTNAAVDYGHKKSVSESAAVADAALLTHLRRENVKLGEIFGLLMLKARALEARVQVNTRKVNCESECNRLLKLTKRSAADCKRMEAEIAAIANTAASDHQKSGQHVESEERMRVNMLARETRAVEDMNRQRGLLEASRKSKQEHCEVESKRIHDDYRFLQENEELTHRRNAIREEKEASLKTVLNLEAELAGRQREFDKNLPKWTQQLSDLESARQKLEAHTKKLLQTPHQA